MIRITTRQEESHTVVTIDGQLMPADLAEVRRVRKSIKGNVLLKLGGLNTCVDEGIRVLRDWLNAGARLSSATPFLQLVLEKYQKV